MTAEAVFHFKRLVPREVRFVDSQVLGLIVRMNAGCPSAAELVFQGTACVLKPRSIQPGAAGVGARHPNEHRSGIRQHAEMGFALPQPGLGPFTFGDVADDGMPASVGLKLGTDLHGQCRSVLPAQLPFTGMTVSFQQLSLDLPQAFVVMRIEQVGHAHAEQFCARISQHVTSPTIHIQVMARHIRHDDTVGSLLKKMSKPFFAFPQGLLCPFPVCDVGDEDIEAFDCSPGCPFRDIGRQERLFVGLTKTGSFE